MAKKLKVASVTELNSLGAAQENLKSASRELELSILAFERAKEKMDKAEEVNAAAVQALNNEIQQVKQTYRVTPLGQR